MSYTVKLEQRRVIAWAQVQYGDDGETILEPITLQVDPRLQHEVYNSIDVTGFENRKLKPHMLKGMIPASMTSLMVLVLCNETGRPMADPSRPRSDQQIEHPLGFFTHGTDYMPVFEQWRKDAEACPQEYFYGNVPWHQEDPNAEEEDEDEGE